MRGCVPAQKCLRAPVEAGGSPGSRTNGTARLCAGDTEGTVRPSQPAGSAGSDSEMSELLRKHLWRAHCWLPKNEIIITLKIPEKHRLVEHIGNFNHFLRMPLITILSSPS